MRSHKIIYKFILVYILIGLAVFVIISSAGSYMIQKKIIAYESLNLYEEASNIAEDKTILTYPASSASDSGTTDDTKTEDLYNSLKRLALYQDCQIWLVSTKGSIYLNTSEPWSGYVPETLEDFDPVALGSDYYSIGRFFNYFSSDYLSVMIPITSNLHIRGYVAIHMDMQKIIELREGLLARVHLLMIMVYCLFLTVFILLYFTVLRPLKKITTGTERFAKGDMKYNIRVNAQDEMGHLAASLNLMSDEISKSDEYEKQFIANVSHDFRSPLTSIKGFVEAILDGTIPPEMQERYLRIVLNETERLTKLTNGILTLNSMDQKKNLLHFSIFDINEEIRNTAASFEGICTPRQISFQLTLTGESLHVVADREKIQQVLYNLIDNAIKFSKDGSVIALESDIRHDKVFCTVRDHGCGIPRASLNKIWDRFYKSDASRGRERKGNGLGLSIVKEIINQHQQTITVVSTEGVGTEFIFSLELAPEDMSVITTITQASDQERPE
ncbi:MAG: sensor histidine kinase [Bilifractor sp.]